MSNTQYGQAGTYSQQGDVIYRSIDKLPEGLTKITTDKKILQMSETTGHHHHFAPTAKVDVYERGGIETVDGVTTITTNTGKYVVVYEESLLYHGKGFEVEPSTRGTGDHKAHLLQPGIYEIDIVREYDYDKMEMGRVVD